MRRDTVEPAADDAARPAHVAPAAAPAPARGDRADRRGPGFVPLLLGGLLAGAIGYAIPTWLAPPVGDTARIEAVEARLEALATTGEPDPEAVAASEAREEALAGEVAALGLRVAEVEARVAEGGGAAPQTDGDGSGARVDEIAGRLDALAGGLEAATGRLDALDGAAVAADDARLALAARVDGLEGDLGGAAGALEARLDRIVVDLGGRVSAVEDGLAQATLRATSVEDEAEARAREAARNQVRIALDSGTPYAEPLAVLGEAPGPLAGVAEAGVATQAALVSQFPPLAREALRTARASGAQGGVGALLSSAFGARSLEPREGTDPDAVLSRAEAAARQGDLAGALGEIDTLPEPARAVLADWSERARARLDALAAADDFLKDG